MAAVTNVKLPPITGPIVRNFQYREVGLGFPANGDYYTPSLDHSGCTRWSFSLSHIATDVHVQVYAHSFNSVVTLVDDVATNSHDMFTASGFITADWIEVYLENLSLTVAGAFILTLSSMSV